MPPQSHRQSHLRPRQVSVASRWCGGNLGERTRLTIVRMSRVRGGRHLLLFTPPAKRAYHQNRLAHAVSGSPHMTHLLAFTPEFVAAQMSLSSKIWGGGRASQRQSPLLCGDPCTQVTTTGCVHPPPSHHLLWPPPHPNPTPSQHNRLIYISPEIGEAFGMGCRIPQPASPCIAVEAC